MDDLDRQIITATQSGLPLVKAPYDMIAQQLNIKPELLKQRMSAMLEQGKIRRIGAVPNHYKLGYQANAMSVWNVPDDMINELGQQLGALDFVSHCYERPRFLPEWPYNLFAMLHGKSKDEVAIKVMEIVSLLGEHCAGYELLYSTKFLKKTGLRLSS
ncbi:Lrp/AsnC family transcriptional regulator [sulfur-oxidizing endosymbiont of Gigantopelta aegis]|uniref:siroheme decarboxylase subunit beta n=1 Tax=sulfur-oxidizing endosymbiont of Gigantopelta aegis TaxID=2794934 RepID=UPI001FE45FE5|nr:Lrp/AsnC family transcriptional regulator [sulfur-oxidizing endosymbiont of Gigantopelta aegis]